MDELRQLLQGAAAAPRPDLDVGGIEGRVIQRRRTRRALVAASAVVLVLASATVVAAWPDPDRESVRTSDEPATTAERSTTTAVTTTTTLGLPGGAPGVTTPVGTGATGAPSPWNVRPTTGLGNYDTVTVEGTGLPPGVYYVGQCPSEARTGDTSRCAQPLHLEITDGHLRADLVVVWRLRGVDCGETPGRCLVGVMGSGQRSTFTPIGFDLTFDPGRRPRIEVTPSTGLVDGQQVEVRGYNLGPSSLSIFPSTDGAYGCGARVDATAPDGTFATALTARYQLECTGGHGMGFTKTCDTGCYIRASVHLLSDPYRYGYGYDLVVPLEFAPGQPTVPTVPPTEPSPTEPPPADSAPTTAAATEATLPRE